MFRQKKRILGESFWLTDTKMKRKKIKKKIKMPEKASFKLDGNSVLITGPKGTASKKILDKGISIKEESGFIIVRSLRVNKNGKRSVGTAASLIKNLVKGVVDGYEYRLKICSGHFPMNVSVAGKEVTIKNFIGEKNPRKCTVKGNVDVQLNKDLLTVKGISKEEVGQAAADIEQATRITNRDRRIFQDGIYIISKEN